VTLWEIIIPFGGSFVAGFLGSVVGLVLGSLRLPAILLASGSPAAAAGANIAVSAAAALSGGLGHARAGRVDWGVVAWMAPPSVVGAFLGGFFGHLIPSDALLVGVSAVLAVNGLDLVLALRPKARQARHPRAFAAGSGLVIGLVGGAVGLILGTLRLPALLGGVGMTPHRAVGTNLAVGFFLGVAGFVGHLARLEIEWAVLAAGLAGAIPGAWLGARATGRLSEGALRKAIGAVLLIVAAVIAVEAGI
jgi:uncharacterized protein